MVQCSDGIAYVWIGSSVSARENAAALGSKIEKSGKSFGRMLPASGPHSASDHLSNTHTVHFPLTHRQQLQSLDEQRNTAKLLYSHSIAVPHKHSASLTQNVTHAVTYTQIHHCVSHNRLHKSTCRKLQYKTPQPSPVQIPSHFPIVHSVNYLLTARMSS